MAGLGVISLQLALIATIISLAMCATVPLEQTQHQKEGQEVVAAESFTHPMGVVGTGINTPMVRFPPSGLSRAKRYIGWGRRPGMRYSKANWDFDNNFNKAFKR